VKMIKKNIISNMAKFKVIHSIPGRIRLKTKIPKETYSQINLHDKYLEEALLMLKGIENIEFNYTIGTVLIKYNTKKTYEKKVLDWLNEIIRVGIENIELIEKYSESNREYVINTVKQQLTEALKKM
jgi:hypothetical protein